MRLTSPHFTVLSLTLAWNFLFNPRAREAPLSQIKFPTLDTGVKIAGLCLLSKLCPTSSLSSWSWNMVTAKWIPLTFDSLLLSLTYCLFAHHDQKYQRILSDTKSIRHIRDHIHSTPEFYTEGFLRFLHWPAQGQIAGQGQSRDLNPGMIFFLYSSIDVMWVYDRGQLRVMLGSHFTQSTYFFGRKSITSR